MGDRNYGQIYFLLFPQCADSKDEKLTPAQVSKMQKALEQARMLMKNLRRPPAKAAAKAKVEPIGRRNQDRRGSGEDSFCSRTFETNKSFDLRTTKCNA